MGSTDQNPVPTGLVEIVLPEMFVYFLAQAPRVSPHYEVIKRESEDWLLR